MNANALLAHFTEQQVAAFFLVMARVSPLFILAPLFSSKSLPARARTIVALAIAVGLMPVVKHGQIDLAPLAFGLLILKEVVVGLAFAYSLAAMFAALQVAGTLLDTLIGFSFGALVDPITGTQSAVIQQMYALFGVAVFITIGGDGWVIKGLGRTYDAVPMLDAPAIGTMVQGAQVAFSGIFVSAFMIAAPVVIAVIVVDAGFGVVSKIVPQMNIMAVGFPAKMIIGLTLIGATLPFVSNFVIGELQASVAQALHALRVG
jgi:flagellar biosynthetic protein FliR